MATDTIKKVLALEELQYFYEKLPTKFATVEKLELTNGNLASLGDSLSTIDTWKGEVETWKTKFYTESSSTPVFKGTSQKVNITNSKNSSKTLYLIGHTGSPRSTTGTEMSSFYTNAQLVQTSVNETSSDKGITSLILGNSTASTSAYDSKGQIKLFGPSSKALYITYERTDNDSYITFPQGGSADIPLIIASMSDVNLVDSKAENINTSVTTLQGTVESHGDSLETLNTAVNTTIPNTYATKESLTTEINKILDGVNAELLDGLNEVIEALNNDPDFYNTMTALINEKASKGELNSLEDRINESLTGKASLATVTTSADGLVPKADASDGTISSSSSDWVFTNKNGTIGWYKLPATAFIPSIATLNKVGGVKSGGHVTVDSSSGIMTVEDNTHKHLASNITDLANLLDPKISATELKVTVSGTGNTLIGASYNSDAREITFTTGNKNQYSLPLADFDTRGGVRPAYSSTNSAILTTTAASNTTTPTIAEKTTTSGRYYGVEADKNGVLFVNVPWDNKVTTTSNSTNTSYPLLFAGSNSPTSSTAYEAFYNSGISVNPNTQTLSTKFLKITDTAGAGQIQFSRAGFNYLWAPTDGTIALAIGSAANQTNSPFCVNATSIIPGVTNAINLGTTSKVWAAVHATSFFGNGANLTNLNASNITTGTLPVNRGGTGATNAKTALTNLGIYYGITAPTSPSEGMIWLQP